MALIINGTHLFYGTENDLQSCGALDNDYYKTLGIKEVADCKGETDYSDLTVIGN